MNRWKIIAIIVVSILLIAGYWWSRRWRLSIAGYTMTLSRGLKNIVMDINKERVVSQKGDIRFVSNKYEGEDYLLFQQGSDKILFDLQTRTLKKA